MRVAPKAENPLLSLGECVRKVREQRGLNQRQAAAAAGMWNTQLSILEKGENVEVKFYAQIAKGLGFKTPLEMFLTGGDELTRKLLKWWAHLDEQARKDVLRIVRSKIVDEAV